MGIFTTEISASGHITGSSNLEILGNISGSATSTGSFGMVGIGTASPSAQLHVYSATNPTGQY